MAAVDSGLLDERPCGGEDGRTSDLHVSRRLACASASERRWDRREWSSGWCFSVEVEPFATGAADCSFWDKDMCAVCLAMTADKLVELPAWLDGGLVASVDWYDRVWLVESPDRVVERVTDLEGMGEESELLDSQSLPDTGAASPAVLAVEPEGSLSIVARRTSSTSSGDAGTIVRGTSFRADLPFPIVPSRFASLSTSIDSVNPATRTCTSSAPTATGIVSSGTEGDPDGARDRLSARSPDDGGLGLGSTSIRSGDPLFVSRRLRISLRIPSSTASTAMYPPVRPTPAEQCRRTGGLPMAWRAIPVKGSTSLSSIGTSSTIVLGTAG